MPEPRAIVTQALLGSDDAPFVPGQEPFPGHGGGIRFRELFEILRRRVRLFAVVAICGTLVVGGLAFLLPPRYTAKAQVVIEDSRAPRGDARVPSRDSGLDQATIQTQVTALSSHDLLVGVIAQLAADPAFRAIQQHRHGSLPELSVAGTGPLAIEKLERHLRVFQESGSHVISVAYTSVDPAEAAAVANKITDYYLAAGEDQSRTAPDQSIAVLTRKIEELRGETKTLEAAVADYQAAHGVRDAAKTNVVDQKLGDLNHQLVAAQSELIARRTRHLELLGSRGENNDWAPLLAGLDAQGLVDVHGQALAVLAGRQDGIVVLPHPVDGSAEAEADPRPLRTKVRRELDQALLKLSRLESAAGAQVAELERRLNSVQRASDDVRLHDLVAAAASARHRFERLVQRRDELLEQRDDSGAPARLLSRAAVPDRPSSLHPLLFLLPGSIAFLVIGCLVALLRDRMDQGIYSENDVASVLGLRCAGFVPLSRHTNPAERAAEGPTVAAAPFTEALRGIMVSLRVVGPQRRESQVILITSSVPGEGKTTLAVNLAACAAGMGAKVLLLDFDVREPVGIARPPAQLPRQDVTGDMVEMLRRDRAPGDVVRTGPRMALDYLPVRRGPLTEPSPLFAGDTIAKLLQHRRSMYDFIFIDSAPVLAKAEVRLLAAIADQIVFVVRWGKTRRDDARAALALLRSGRANGAETAPAISAAITQVDLGRYGHGVQADALSKYAQYSTG